METPRILFLVLAIGLIFLWLVVALLPRKPPEVAGPVTELRYGRFLRVLALVIALLIPALMVFVVWFLPWSDARHPMLAGCAFLALSLLGGLLHLEVERVRLFVTDDALISYSPWHRRHEIRWAEVQNVAYSSVNRWFVITGPGGRAIRASRSLVGLPALLAVLKHKVTAPRSAKVQAFLEKVS